VTYTLQPHLVRIEQELNRKLFRTRAASSSSTATRCSRATARRRPTTSRLRSAARAPARLDDGRRGPPLKNLPPKGGKFAEIYDPEPGAALGAAPERNLPNLHKKLMKSFCSCCVTTRRRERKPLNLVRNRHGEATLYIYDVIDLVGRQRPEQVAEAIMRRSIPDTTLHLRINSPGGDVFEGRAIRTHIAQFAGKTIAHIDGLAASAATTIADGADEIEIVDGGFYMIHNGWTICYGNKHELRKTADLLEKVDGAIVADYAKRTGKTSRSWCSGWTTRPGSTADEAVEQRLRHRKAAERRQEPPEQRQALEPRRLRQGAQGAGLRAADRARTRLRGAARPQRAPPAAAPVRLTLPRRRSQAAHSGGLFFLLITRKDTMSMQALRERLSAINKDANNLLAEKGSQTWSKDDQAKFDGLMDEAERTQRRSSAPEACWTRRPRSTSRTCRARKRTRPATKKSAKGVELFLRKMTNELTPGRGADHPQHHEHHHGLAGRLHGADRWWPRRDRR
jgi:ATP-dependent Clp protease protease subunit